MLRKEIILGLNKKERLEENDDVSFAIKQVTMQRNALIERTLTVTMIKISLMAIEGMENSTTKEKGMLEIKEEGNHSRRLEIPSMNLTLLTISKLNIIYQLLYLPPLLRTQWEFGSLIVVPQDTSPVTKKYSIIW